MVNVTAYDAHELCLRAAGLGVHRSAGRARLRTVRCGHLDEAPARPLQLVAQEGHQRGPSCATDAASEPASDLNHVLRAQALDDDGAVALGVGRGKNMQDMIPLAADLAMQLGYTELRFFSIGRSFLSSANRALGPTKTVHSGFKMTWVGDDAAIAVGDEVDYATIKCNDGHGAWNRVGHLDNARDGREPLARLLDESACFGGALNLAVKDNADVVELGEMQTGVTKAPHLWVRLTQRDVINALALPARSLGQLGEAPLPRLVELNEQLGADIAWDIREPGEYGAEFGQLVDLIEGRVVPPLAPWPIQAPEALLQRKIPEKAQRVLPRPKARSLPGRGVKAVAESLAHDHGRKYTLVYAARKRLPYRKACCFQLKRTLGLCAEVPSPCDHEEGVRGTSFNMGHSLRRFRVRAQGGEFRARSCAPTRRVSTKGIVVHAREFSQGRQRQKTSRGSSTRCVEQTLGRSLLVSFILRGFLRWSPTGNRCQIRQITAGCVLGLLPALKGGVSARGV